MFPLLIFYPRIKEWWAIWPTTHHGEPLKTFGFNQIRLFECQQRQVKQAVPRKQRKNKRTNATCKDRLSHVAKRFTDAKLKKSTTSR